ncbi:hypothetical protein [Salipaludibacillus neizhouensis]|uniref:hypothetical protein n=1 Tax=Salipaludibacillus neizhouensis TaxID=885475 RepID=UPI001602C11C|nr:hypothetical protein [Salipaludibacillus neizhouensis]
MDSKNLEILSDHELHCIYESSWSFLEVHNEIEHSHLKDFLLLLEVEIRNRNIDKE